MPFLLLMQNHSHCCCRLCSSSNCWLARKTVVDWHLFNWILIFFHPNLSLIRNLIKSQPSTIISHARTPTSDGWLLYFCRTTTSIIMESTSSSSRPILAPTVTVSTSGNGSPGSNKPPAVAESLTSITAHRRKRLVRSENVCCSHHQGWEAIFRESLLHMAWPISLSMSSDQAETFGMGDFLPLKIRSVFWSNS